MNRYKIQRVIMAASILIVCSVSNVYAQMNTFGERGCEYVWKQGVSGEMIGGNSFYTGDIDNDGVTEIICCVETRPFRMTTFWYIMEYDVELADYRQVWISNGYPAETGLITAIDVITTDFDGEQKICIAINTGVIEVFNAKTLQRESTIRIPENAETWEITSILAADADNDNQQELVICTKETTFMFKIPDYTLDHRFDYGGIVMKCGNVNSDPWVELIYANGIVICLTPSDPEPQITANFPTPDNWGIELHIDIGDIDNDQMMELIQVIDEKLIVWDVDTRTTKLSKLFDDKLNGVLVADANGNGNPEIIVYEDDSWQAIICLNSDGSELWKIEGNFDSGIAGLSIGDFDNDNQQEILWICGTQTTAEDQIYIYSLLPVRVLEWKSTYMEAPYLTLKVGDVDGDGQKEIVTLRSNYEGVLSVFDAVTHKLEWESEKYWERPYDFQIFDIDYDGEMEIILCGYRIKVINGTTHEVESSHPVLDSYDYRWLEIADIDNNGIHEYIITDGREIIIVDPSDYGILWSSRNKNGSLPNERTNPEFFDFMAGNVDDDPEIEILINSYGKLICYDVVNHQQFTMDVEPYSAACLFDSDKDGIMEIYLCAPDGSLGFIDARTQTYYLLPLTINKNVNEIKAFYPPGSETPVMAFLYDDKLRFIDFHGHMSIPKVLGEFHSDGIELFDTGNDGTLEIFVISYNMITEFRSDCFLPVGEPEYDVPAACRVYPNPTANLICLEIDKIADNDAFAFLISMQGDRIAEFNLGEGKNIIDLTSYPTGLYLLNVSSGNEFFTVKVIRN